MRLAFLVVVSSIKRPSDEIHFKWTGNDTKRILFPMTEVKGLSLNENIKVSTLFYKNGFIMLKPVYFPYKPIIDIPKTVKRIQKRG